MTGATLTGTPGGLGGLGAVQQRIQYLNTLLGTGSAASTSFGGALGAAMASTTAAADPGATPVVAGSGASATGAGGADAVIADAKRFLGVPYQWGGTTPAGFDCSGLTQYVYGQNGVTLPRVAADQAKTGTAVTAAQAAPGDLVFFGSPVDHVGIYLGNGQMLDAPHTGAQVRIESVDLSTCSAIRRVLPGSGVGGTSASGAAPGWASGLPAAGRQYAAAIQTAAARSNIDPRLLASLVWQESGFNASARSAAGASGLVQLMPQTAAGLGVDPLNPAQALDGGARYLAAQLQRFGGRADLALAAYNAGPAAVVSSGGVPPYPETQNYVSTVLAHYRDLGGSA